MLRTLRVALMVIIALVGAGPSRATAAAPHISITDLGTLPGDDKSAGFDINERGQIVGWSEGSVPSEYHPVLWDRGAIVALPGTGFATSINDRGQIVGGRTSISGGALQTHAARWADGTITDLEELPDSNYSLAYAINESSEIVGVCITGSSDDQHVHAVSWRNGSVADLGTLPGDSDSFATGINARGDVAGSSQLQIGPDAEFRPVLWQLGRITELASPPDGTAGGSAADVNNRGQAVGTAEFAGSTHAALWQGGAIFDLGLLPGDTLSVANAINDRGEIVGMSLLDPPYEPHAVLWIDGHIVPLGALPGSDASYASTINNRGRIVGTSSGRAVVWDIGSSKSGKRPRLSGRSAAPHTRH